MKLKIVVLFFLGSVVFAACSKKQCPAYGQQSEKSVYQSVKV